MADVPGNSSMLLWIITSERLPTVLGTGVLIVSLASTVLPDIELMRPCTGVLILVVRLSLRCLPPPAVEVSRAQAPCCLPSLRRTSDYPWPAAQVQRLDA